MSRILISILLLATALGAAAGPWPLSDFELGPAEGAQQASAVAAGGDGFLVAWIDRRKAPNAELRATVLDPEGNIVDRNGLLIFTGDVVYGWVGNPRLVWTGERWVVVFATPAGLMTVSVSPDGTVDAAPRLVASSQITPTYGFEAVTIGDRIYVAGSSSRGTSFLILDAYGKLLAHPRLVARQYPQGSIIAVLAASRDDELLIVEASFWASCPACSAFVAHRIRADGTEIEMTPISDGPRPEFRSYEMAPHGDGYLIVGQKREDGEVEMWALSSQGTSVTAQGIIARPSAIPDANGQIVLQATNGGTDAFFFLPSTDGQRVLNRARVSDDGRITSNAPFPLEDATGGEIAFAMSPSRVVAAMTRSYGESESDVVARSARSIELLAEASTYHLAFSAPEQRDARAVRRGDETLVTWIEGRTPTKPGQVLARRLGADGRPTAAPPIRLLDDSDYAIASNGLEYLVATMSGSSLRVRRLRADLRWRDSAWTTIAMESCGYLNHKSVAWDGLGWWLAWSSCGSGNPMLRRLDRDLRPLTRAVELDGHGAPTVQIVPVDGAILALWPGEPSGCNIGLCPPPVFKLFGARLNGGGLVVTPPARIVDNVDGGFVAFASRGSEVLAIWSGGGYPNATRITRELVALDVVESEWGLRGELLEDAGLSYVDIGWDGEEWVAATETFVYVAGLNWQNTWRRFAPGGDLSTLWQKAATRDLGRSAERTGTTIVVSAAPGTATLLLEPVVSKETTDVRRYFIRNMSDPPRSRGVRR